MPRPIPVAVAAALRRGHGAPSGVVGDGLFLPDFCSIRTVFVVVVLGELLAFVLALASSTGAWRRLEELALVSLLVQWLALSCTAVLCLARRWLGGFGEAPAAAAALLLAILTIALVSEIAWQVVAHVDPRGLLLGGAHADFLLRNVAIGTVVAALALRYCYVQYHWQRQLEAEAEARLQALQARIRPHFFFNCMNTIASLTRRRPEVAERAIENLAELFRVSLADARELVGVEEELALCRSYLEIEQLRLGERLQLRWELDAIPAQARLPVLTLQPLLENAVYHGIEPRPEGGVVTVRSHSRPGRLVLEIENPLAAAADGQRPGNRLAQDNVRDRLAAHFGDAAKLQVERLADAYRVRVQVPVQS